MSLKKEHIWMILATLLRNKTCQNGSDWALILFYPYSSVKNVCTEGKSFCEKPIRDVVHWINPR